MSFNKLSPYRKTSEEEPKKKTCFLFHKYKVQLKFDAWKNLQELRAKSKMKSIRTIWHVDLEEDFELCCTRCDKKKNLYNFEHWMEASRIISATTEIFKQESIK